MEKEEFKNLVEKYKSELMKMAKTNMQLDDKKEEVKPSVSPVESVTEEEVNPPEEEVLYTGDGTKEKKMSYSEFLEQNPSKGKLRIQAFTARRALPVRGVEVVISKEFEDGDKIFYTLTTDENGIIDGIVLPTPDGKFSQQPGDIQPYSTYSITASHPDYVQEKYSSVPVFDGVKSIQPIKLLPKGTM